MASERVDFTDEAEAAWHRRVAEDVFGLYFEKSAEIKAERNVLSLESTDMCFARRLDCNTYFVQPQHTGKRSHDSVFRGEDREQFAVLRRIFQSLGISEIEIAREEILREFGQAAQFDRHTSKVVHLEPASELGNFIHVTRQQDAIPIWSSHLKMSLTARREIGFLELHWPAVPEPVIWEAKRLVSKVANGWKAPEVASAKVERIEAGVVHTPAVGYFFDIHAAVRVIYRSLEPHIGRKPMYHFDRHGDPVLLRRTAELISEQPLHSRPRRY